MGSSPQKWVLAAGLAGVWKRAMMIGGDPLRGVDDVPWGRLYHAFGPAVDVPDQLRALRNLDPARRANALSQLWSNVYHQGSRWQASSAVVPFLAALIDDTSTADRVQLLALLTGIAIGDRRDDQLPFDPIAAFPVADCQGGADQAELLRRFYGEGDLTDDELRLVQAEAVRWEAASYHATATHLLTIAGWVSDRDDEVAANAAALLPWLPPHPAASSALLDVPAHRGPVRASANLAVGYARQTDPRIERMLQQLLTNACDPVAVTAAVALAHRSAAPPDRAVSILIDASTQDLPTRFTGWDRAPRGFVMLALQRLGLG